MFFLSNLIFHTCCAIDSNFRFVYFHTNGGCALVYFPPQIFVSCSPNCLHAFLFFLWISWKITQKRSARWKHNQVYLDLLLCQIKKLLKPGNWSQSKKIGVGKMVIEKWRFWRQEKKMKKRKSWIKQLKLILKKAGYNRGTHQGSSYNSYQAKSGTGSWK